MNYVSDLTNQKFYNLLKAFMEERGYTPTIRELGEYVGLKSSASVYYHIDKLEKRGLIERVNNRKIVIKEWENKQ